MKKLEKALRDVYEKELLDDVHYAKRQPDHSFSQVHNHNMKMALKDKPNPVISFITNHSAKVACVAVMGFAAFMIGTAVMQNGGVKSGTDEDKNTSVSQVTKENETEKDKPVNKDDENSSNGEFVVGEKETESGTDIYLDYEEPGMETIDEIGTFYNPTFIPQEFELSNSTGDEYKDFYYCLTYYQKDENLQHEDVGNDYWDNRIYYAQFLKQKYTDVLVGNNIMSETEDNGITYTIINYADQKTRSYVWATKYYVFLVGVPMSFTLEEGLEICRSVEPTNEILLHEDVFDESSITYFYLDKEIDINGEQYTRLYYLEYFMDTVNEIKSHYAITTIPEGFKLNYTSLESNTLWYDCSYINESKDSIINFTQTLKQDFEVYYREDTVDIGTYEDYLTKRDQYDSDIFLYTYKDGDIKYTISESKEYKTKCYMWPMEHYILQVLVPYDYTMEQGLEVCRSVKAVSPEDMVYAE